MASSTLSSGAAVLCPTARASVRAVVCFASGHDVEQSFAGLGTPLVGTKAPVTVAAARALIIAMGKGEGVEGGDSGEESDVAGFLAKLDAVKADFSKEMRLAGSDPLLLRNPNLQLTLAMFGGKAEDLVRQVVLRLKPTKGSTLEKELFDTAVKMACAEVSGQEYQAPWGYAHALSCELHGLRCLVSGALDVPIPRRKAVVLPTLLLENDDMELALLAIVEAAYDEVARDVLEMMG